MPAPLPLIPIGTRFGDWTVIANDRRCMDDGDDDAEAAAD